jgi:FixJ family two-component response regulator
MPGLDGPALYEALRTRHHFPTRFPTTLPRVVFMTGHAPGHAEFLRGTTEPILEKPFSLKVVRKVVRVLLAGQLGATADPEEQREGGAMLSVPVSSPPVPPPATILVADDEENVWAP